MFPSDALFINLGHLENDVVRDRCLPLGILGGAEIDARVMNHKVQFAGVSHQPLRDIHSRIRERQSEAGDTSLLRLQLLTNGQKGCNYQACVAFLINTDGR